MAIQTRIAPHFGWKYLIMAAVCLVLGLWGVWDYVEVIPSRQQAHERGDTARAVRDAIVPGASSEERTAGLAALQDEQQRFAEQYPHAAESPGPLPSGIDEVEAFAEAVAEQIDSLREEDQTSWAAALILFESSLAAPPVRENQALTGTSLHAYEVVNEVLGRVGNIKRPSTYDRPTQWAFIACLPFVPWCLWVYFATKRRVYRLDDDGTLHLSEAGSTSAGRSWKPEDIADIDMSQWMRKSIAWVVHRDGTRVKLDDYKHKNLHLIVGAIAARLYPKEWDAEAKPVKKSGSEYAGETAGADADGMVDEPPVEKS